MKDRSVNSSGKNPKGRCGRFLACLFLLWLPHFLIAQNNLLKIRILDGQVPVLGISLSIRQHTVAASNVAGYAEISYHPGDTLRIRSIQFEPVVIPLNGNHKDTLTVHLRQKVYALDEVTIHRKTAADILGQALKYISHSSDTYELFMRQYLAENGVYNKLSEGTGTVYWPAKIWKPHKEEDWQAKEQGWLVETKFISIRMNAVHLIKNHMETQADYVFNPASLISFALCPDGIWRAILKKEVIPVLQSDSVNWIIRISKSDKESHMASDVSCIIDKLTNHLVALRETYVDNQGITSTYTHEYSVVDNLSVLSRSVHEQRLPTKKTTYFGGQEIFFFPHHPKLSDLKGNLRASRPDLKNVDESLRDSASVDDYKNRHQIPVIFNR